MALYFIENQTNVEKVVIGEIDFGEVLNETNVEKKELFPKFKKSFSGKCTIEVYGREGEHVPHFHIISDDKSFECCICIFENRFFTHGKHKDVLARKDWKTLDDWMRKENILKKFKNVDTNWDSVVAIWKGLNDDNNSIDADTVEQPDYTTIKPYKEK